MSLASSEHARLRLDGVPAPIRADVTRRRADGLVVTRALPFLRLDTPVTAEDGRRARISRVSIAMDGDVPRLLLELLDEPSGQDAERTLAGLGHGAIERATVAQGPLAQGPLAQGPLERTANAGTAAERARLAQAPDARGADDTLESFTPGVSARPARKDSTVPYELGGARREVHLADEATPAPETLARLAPPRRSRIRQLLRRARRWLLSWWRPALG